MILKSNGQCAIAGLVFYVAAIVSAVVFAGSQAGCVTVAPQQSAQVAYAQSCAAYAAAFDVLVALRKGGKLNQAQIDQVTLIDGQITPVCTGTMPQDPTEATQHITAAVTSLTILEAVKP